MHAACAGALLTLACLCPLRAAGAQPAARPPTLGDGTSQSSAPAAGPAAATPAAPESRAGWDPRDPLAEPLKPAGRSLLSPLQNGAASALHDLFLMPRILGGHLVGAGHMRLAGGVHVRLQRNRATSGNDSLMIDRGTYDVFAQFQWGVVSYFELGITARALGRLGGQRLVDEGTTLLDVEKNVFEFGDPVFELRWVPLTDETSPLAAVSVGFSLKPGLGSPNASRTGGLDFAINANAMLEPPGPRTAQKFWQLNIGLGYGRPDVGGKREFIPGASERLADVYFVGISFGGLVADWGPTNFGFIGQVQAYSSALRDLISLSTDVLVDLLVGIRVGSGRWEGTFSVGITPNVPGETDWHLLLVLRHTFPL